MSKDNNQDDDRTESLGDLGNRPDRPRIDKLGQFKIESTLGSGGMGTIYRAYDESMKRPVALKVLHSSLEISEQAQTRFVREAWIVGQLDHPNIVKVYSRGEENNVSYLAMELVEGGSLYDYVEHTRDSIPSGSDVTATIDQNYIHDILGKFIELAGALEHIHSKGFIHRDIKPHNVLLSGEEKKFKFTDFGIAHAEDMTRMTRAGDFIGTVKYMSPELLAAHRAGIDKRTDIYSLGVTLYEALTLSLPFKADSEEKLIGEILAGHYNEARKSNRRIPVDLETVLMKACNHDPDQRYQTAAEFADDLQRIIDGRPILAKRPGLVTRGYKYLRRNYKAVLGIAAACAIMTVIVLWSYYKVEQAYRTTLEQQPSAQLSPEPTFTKIDVPGLTEYCALSPDGEKIAFVAEDSCLWVAPTHGRADPAVAGEATRLTEPMVRWTGTSCPVWSANGEWIAFNARGTRDSSSNVCLSIFVVRSSGGDPIEIPVKQWSSFSWRDCRLGLSPDGKYIAFSSDSVLVAGESIARCVYAAPVAGGIIKRLTDSLCGQPAYSPDGKMLAYVQGNQSPWDRDSLAQSNIWVVPVKGGTPVQVTDLPGVISGPVWSQNSRMIAFSKWSDYTDLNTRYFYKEVYIVALSDQYRPLAPPVAIKLPGSSTDLIGGWSTANEIGLILMSEVPGAIYTVPASGGIATQVTPFHAYSPRWSPDGKNMYFLDDSAVVTMAIAGGSPKNIPITGMKEVSYSNCDISPDGTTLVFAGIKEGDSVVSVFTVPVEGGEPKQLVFDSLDSQVPSWSPDGNWVAFSSYSHSAADKTYKSNLCVVPADGGNVRKLVVSAETDSYGYDGGQMTWSPDGKYIAYPSYRDDSLLGISRVPFDGGNPELLVELGPHYLSWSVDWSPDGTKLAYGSFTINQKSVTDGNVWILPLDTRTPFKLRTGLELERVGMVDWSPDGRRIAFTCHWRPARHFYLVEDFLPIVQSAKSAPNIEPSFSMVTVPGLLDYCALSPDGKKIAYASDSCLWVAPTRGTVDPNLAGEPVKVAGPLNMIPLISLPVWSADGNWIAFNSGVEIVKTSHVRVSIFVVPSSGGKISEVPVVHDGKDAWNCFRISLSPDGERVAFYSFTSPIPDDSSTDCIYSMPVAGGEILRLTDSMCRQPAYSPDGKMLAYVKGHQKSWGYDSLQSNIWVVPVDGGTPVQITNLPGREFSPVWSPDSRSITFFKWAKLSGSGYGFPELYVAALSESYEPTGSPIAIELPLPSDDFIGGWSSENEVGLVVESEPFAAIFTVSVSGGLASQITPSVSYSPSWSPDGDRVFYQSGDRKIRSVAAAGGQVSAVPITGKSRVSAVGLDVSPDGHWLALVGIAERDSTRDIFIVPVEGGDLLQISSGTAQDWFPAWSPDGNWIAFDRFEGMKDMLCVVPSKGGEVRVLVRSDDSTGYSGYPVSWSPDGKYIAYPSYREGSKQCVSTVPFEGGDSEALIELPPGIICNSVSWSPDGKQLAYCTHISEYGGTSSDIWILSLDTRIPVRLRFGHDLDEIDAISWSPDGKMLVFDGERIQDNTLYLVSDFLPDK